MTYLAKITVDDENLRTYLVGATNNPLEFRNRYFEGINTAAMMLNDTYHNGIYYNTFFTNDGQDYKLWFDTDYGDHVMGIRYKAL
jgi:hypothetical protein